MSKQLKIYTVADKKEEASLRKKSIPVTEEKMKDHEFKGFLENLLYTAQHSEEQDNVSADGIAAPQVGENLRVFYILNYNTNEWQIFINPEVQPLGFVKIYSIEGCLSVPDKEEEVMRYKKVKVKYQDADGKWKTEKFENFNAIAIQHELDHLDGILFIDRIE